MWQFVFKVSNAAITVFLKISKHILLYFGQIFNCDQLKKVADKFPVTIKSAHQIVSLQNNDFESFVVCSSCDSIYDFNDCVERSITGQNSVSKKCRHVCYPNHPHASRRTPCETILLKKVKCKRSIKLLPVKVYPYKKLKDSIERLVRKEGFLEICEHWRKRAVPEGCLCDVYEGNIWKKFNSSDKNNFLQSPHCYLMSMNVDWFEPFERGVYSTGVIYLTILNLPRNERYKPENIIVVGIIPGPKEPKQTINSYLMPLVYELKEAWELGINVKSHDNSVVCIKLALSCITCDIPATRKVCGFLGHNATLGCNKCLKEFDVTFGEKTDFSGFDTDE